MNDNETIADVIAWLRKPREGENAYLTLWRDEIADRLEAAHRRERGNAAKLREALIKARSAICHFARYQCQSLSWENSNIQANCGDVLCPWRGLCEAKTAINAALAEPVKNCEVGTAMEQGERFSAYCRAHKHPKSECLPCPLFGQTGGHCELAWAQIPYAEQEGGDK